MSQIIHFKPHKLLCFLDVIKTKHKTSWRMNVLKKVIVENCEKLLILKVCVFFLLNIIQSNILNTVLGKYFLKHKFNHRKYKTRLNLIEFTNIFTFIFLLSVFQLQEPLNWELQEIFTFQSDEKFLSFSSGLFIFVISWM